MQPRNASGSTTAPSLRRLNALDARVNALRAEARTGLESSEVRRTLIKEQLRPLPRPPSTPAQPPHRAGQLRDAPDSTLNVTSSSRCGSDSAGHVRVQALGGGSDDRDVLPAAWLTGDFELDTFPVLSDVPLSTQTSSVKTDISAPLIKVTSSSPSSPARLDSSASTAVGIEYKSAAVNAAEVPSHVSYATALQAYQTLCATAKEIVYDVPYEEGLRRVESRDGSTGLATSWRTRRHYSAPLLSVMDQSVLVQPSSLLPNATDASRPGTNQTRASRTGVFKESATAPALYTAPSLSRGGTTAATPGASSVSPPPSRSSSCAASQLTLSRPSLRSINTTTRRGSLGGTTVRSSGTTGTTGGGVHGRAGRPGGTTPASTVTSSVGTAVVRNTAAHYATALRQLVKAQRESTTVASTSTAAGGGGVNGEPEEAQWCTRVAAAVTLAVCPSCGAMFAFHLTASPSSTNANSARESAGATSRLGVEAESATSLAGRTHALASTAPCPKCGFTVQVCTDATPSVSPSETTAVGAFDSHPWLLPPRAQEAFPALMSAAKQGTSVPLPPAVVPTTVRSSEVAGGDGSCGTDSVGFAEAAGEESFAALIARIRASKRGEEDKAGAKKTASTRATTSTSTGAETAEAEAGAVHGQTNSLWQLPQSVLPAATPVDPMATRLRAALSHLYYFELLPHGRSGESERKDAER